MYLTIISRGGGGGGNTHLIYQLAFYFILEIDVREVKWYPKPRWKVLLVLG